MLLCHAFRDGSTSPFFPVWGQGKDETFWFCLFVFWLSFRNCSLPTPVSDTVSQATGGPAQARQGCQLRAEPKATASPLASSWKFCPGVFAPLVGKQIQKRVAGGHVNSTGVCAFGVPGCRLKKHDGVNRRFNISPKCQSLKCLLEQQKCLYEAGVKAQTAVKFLQH